MVTRVVLLDAGPLGLATNPKPSPSNLACSAWLQSLIEAGVRVIVPEIADFEVRRELLRANKINGLLTSGLAFYVPFDIFAKFCLQLRVYITRLAKFLDEGLNFFRLPD